jgi:hypothetical protein
LIGCGRPAIASVRDATWMPGDYGNRGSGGAPDRLVKTGFRAKQYFELHHFPFRFQPPLTGRLLYNQPLALALRVSGLVK